VIRTNFTIEPGFVYENEAEEQRLVVSLSHNETNPVAIWRTPDANLPKGAKAQGSATVVSFQKWAVKMRRATTEDWSAFEQVVRRRAWRGKDTVAINRIKSRLLRQA